MANTYRCVNNYKSEVDRGRRGIKKEMTCKGICIRHKAQKPSNSGRYAIGQKRCQICEIFIKWDGIWCPCCGYRLRTRPRNKKYKARLIAGKKQRRSPIQDTQYYENYIVS